MLIPIQQLVRRYNPQFTGVIHVGGHWLEEYQDYKSAGIERQVWIEPCMAAYMEMVKKATMLKDDNLILIRGACGEKEEHGVVMNVSPANQGQSNSILKPELHLSQHPEIQFTDTELIDVYRLDDMEIEKGKYNFLAMDCQGFEGYVLKGATETLKHIDYVYTEVNKAAVYTGNTLIEEMDELLNEFTRVETSWVGNWGDAFYIRKTKMN